MPQSTLHSHFDEDGDHLYVEDEPGRDGTPRLLLVCERANGSRLTSAFLTEGDAEALVRALLRYYPEIKARLPVETEFQANPIAYVSPMIYSTEGNQDWCHTSRSSPPTPPGPSP